MKHHRLRHPPRRRKRKRRRSHRPQLCRVTIKKRRNSNLLREQEMGDLRMRMRCNDNTS